MDQSIPPAPAWFRGYVPGSPYQATQYSRRNLPHRHAEACTVFLTWRLAGTIPVAMQGADRPVHRHAIPPSRVRTAPLLDSASAQRTLTAVLHQNDGERYRLHAYAVMPTHVHVLVTPGASQRWQDAASTWRRVSAYALVHKLGWRPPVWQKECFDRFVRNWVQFLRYRAYILRNPGNLAAGRYVVWAAPLDGS